MSEPIESIQGEQSNFAKASLDKPIAPSHQQVGQSKPPADHVVRAILRVASKGVRITGRLIGALLQEQIEILFYHDQHGWTWRPNSIMRALNRMEDRSLIERVLIDDELTLQLTPAGQARLDRYDLDDLVLPERPDTWDGQWRIVIFDVPEERRYLRGVFRRKLQQLGFKYLQRSAWIYPHPCEAVLIDLSKRLKLGEFLHVAVVNLLSSDDLVRTKFHLPKTQVNPPKPIVDIEKTFIDDRPGASDARDEFVDLLPIEEIESGSFG